MQAGTQGLLKSSLRSEGCILSHCPFNRILSLSLSLALFLSVSLRGSVSFLWYTLSLSFPPFFSFSFCYFSSSFFLVFSLSDTFLFRFFLLVHSFSSLPFCSELRLARSFFLCSCHRTLFRLIFLIGLGSRATKGGRASISFILLACLVGSILHSRYSYSLRYTHLHTHILFLGLILLLKIGSWFVGSFASLFHLSLICCGDAPFLFSTNKTYNPCICRFFY